MKVHALEEISETICTLSSMGFGDTEFPADNDEEEWKFMHERGAWNEFAHSSLYGSARLKNARISFQ